MAVTIHPTAQVSPKAELGENVTIGHCAVVEDNVFIGDYSRVEAFASVKAHTRMGKSNVIHSYAMVGCEPQDLKFHGEVSWLEMGDNNNVREFSTLSRGTEAGGGRRSNPVAMSGWSLSTRPPGTSSGTSSRPSQAA